MKILKRILIGVLGLILLTIMGVYIFISSTKPDYSGELHLEGMKENVEVLYDNFGVPHIYANNEEDAYFALGYVHAQDRLFQMEMLRRAAGGRLSEIIGDKVLPIDKLFRTLRLNQFAEEQANKFLSSDTSAFQRAALAYQRGINTYIKVGKTPIEFTIMGIPKTEFTPKDIYLAVGFMAFGFAEGMKIDPVLQQIRMKWGDEYLKDLAVNTPANAVKIPSNSGAIKTQEELISSIHHALSTLPIPQWVGSNGWAISGVKTESGKPILENDTHMQLVQPTIWYEAHLNYPGFNFYGHHAAGIPFGLLGQNDFCGWGLTMFENDDVDFFYEQTDNDHVGQVKRVEGWDNIKSINEVIKVKGGADVNFEVRVTSHGPIVNGIVENIEADNPLIALDWQLLHGDNTALQAAYGLNHAATFQDVQNSVKQFTAPGLNVMYADVSGNIAWWAVAKLPIRKNPNSKFFLDASTGMDDYNGYYDFSKNPHSINPPNGFVYSANNQPDTIDGNYFPGYYYPRDRAGRIVTLLSEEKRWTIDDVKKVNLDVTSTEAVKIAREMSSVLEQNPITELAEVSSVLHDWDGNHRIEDIGPSVYYNMLSQVIDLSMADELGNEALYSISSISIMKNSYLSLLSNDNSPWWDDVKTEVKETRSDIFIQAALKTKELLRLQCGDNISDWTWGKIHTLKHLHPLSAVEMFDPFFSVGPLVVPGGNEVINNLHFDLDTTGYFKVTGGPALRKIVDFSDLGGGITVSPTGQSGNFKSEFYDDQAQMYAKGEFRRMLTKREDVEKSVKYRLKIKKAQ